MKYNRNVTQNEAAASSEPFVDHQKVYIDHLLRAYSIQSTGKIMSCV